MGTSVPWSGGLRERFASRDGLAPAAAAASASPMELMRQHSFGAYFFSTASCFDPTEAKLAFPDSDRPWDRIRLQPAIGLRPHRALRRSSIHDC